MVIYYHTSTLALYTINRNVRTINFCLEADLYFSVFTETDTGNALSDEGHPLRAPRRALRAPPDFPDYPSARPLFYGYPLAVIGPY